jgi:hypothetical protein
LAWQDDYRTGRKFITAARSKNIGSRLRQTIILILTLTRLSQSLMGIKKMMDIPTQLINRNA